MRDKGDKGKTMWSSVCIFMLYACVGVDMYFSCEFMCVITCDSNEHEPGFDDDF